MAWADPATEKQIAYIEALCFRLLIDPAVEARMFCGLSDLERLTVKQASKFIERLLRIEGRRKRGGGQGRSMPFSAPYSEA